VVSSAGDSVASGRSRVLESRDQIASTLLLVLLLGCRELLVWVVLSLLVSPEFAELGKLASGRVLSWIKEPFPQ
jgi:hypothetical protein